MASGHANRANRPNAWLHRPAMRREVLTCQPGAGHTWHFADISCHSNDDRSWGQAAVKRKSAIRPSRTQADIGRSTHRHLFPTKVCGMYVDMIPL
jgi:hypothetical protein